MCGPELRLFVIPYSTCLSPQHRSGSVRQCDALPVSARREDTPGKHRHLDHQGEHRGGVQQPGARGVCVCVCVCYVGEIHAANKARLHVSLQNIPGVVECLKIITRSKSLRIADYAFRTAQAKGRQRVTAVHKANIMCVSDDISDALSPANTRVTLPNLCSFVGAGSWVTASSCSAVRRLPAVTLKSPSTA